MPDKTTARGIRILSEDNMFPAGVLLSTAAMLTTARYFPGAVEEITQSGAFLEAALLTYVIPTIIIGIVKPGYDEKMEVFHKFKNGIVLGIAISGATAYAGYVNSQPDQSDSYYSVVNYNDDTDADQDVPATPSYDPNNNNPFNKPQPK